MAGRARAGLVVRYRRQPVHLQRSRQLPLTAHACRSRTRARRRSSTEVTAEATHSDERKHGLFFQGPDGRAAISLEGLHDGDRPQLKVRGGVDASQLVLATDTM
jgi:hypothetical protein